MKGGKNNDLQFGMFKPTEAEKTKEEGERDAHTRGVK